MEAVIVNGLRFQIVLDDGFFTYQKKRDPKIHCHLNHELYFSERGECVVLCDNQKYSFNEKELFLIPTNTEHNILNLSENASIYSLRFSFSSLDSSNSTEFYYKLKSKLSQPLKFEEAVMLTELLQQVRLELSRLDDMCTEKIQGLLLNFFAEFSRQLANGYSLPMPKSHFSIEFDLSDTKKLPGYCKDIPDEFYMDMLDEFFTHSLRDNPTLKSLANSLHLSIRQTQRIIKKYYNLSFQQKLLKTKIEQSKSLMASTTLSLEQISKMVGYESYTAFFDAFRSQLGSSPSDYRHSLRKNR